MSKASNSNSSIKRSNSCCPPSLATVENSADTDSVLTYPEGLRDLRDLACEEGCHVGAPAGLADDETRAAHRRRTSFYTAAIAMVVVSWRGVEATAPAVRAKRGQPPPPPRKILVEAAGYAASGTGEYYRIEPAPLTLLSSNR